MPDSGFLYSVKLSSHRARRYLGLGLGAALALAAAAPLPSRAATYTATAAHLDTGLTAALRAAMDGQRKAAGLEGLFARSTYLSQAKSMAVKLANGQSVSQPADRTPATWIGWPVSEATLRYDANDAIAAVAGALHEVLTYKLHTDGGWAVAVRTDGVGGATLGVVGLVGWPDPAPVGANVGCASEAGYCWASRGVNPHLPWTRNQLKVYLSTAGLPSAGESLLRSAIARIQAVPGLGVDLVYGGRTTATNPGDGHRFLVQWGSTSACGSTVLACTVTETQGSYKLVFGARMVVIASRYSANPRTETWVGTLAHELGHALGLGHFDGTYAGSYQLMRWAGGPTTVRSGDVNGFRKLDRPGRLSVSLRSAAPAFRAGTQAHMAVVTSSTGFGGVRSVAVQCYDRYGRLQTPARRTGVWDVRGRSQTLSWTVGSGSAYASSCRAVATSKAASAYSPWVEVAFGG